MSPRLTAAATLPETVAGPGYRPEAHGVGIVHLGLGAFHKAHQAVYTDAALAAAGGDWRILGVSLRSAAPAEALAPQNGRYTVIARGAGQTEARVIGALAGALRLGHARRRILDALVSPETRIVSLTVTEKGYGLDRATGGVDPDHPAIAADLARPEAPSGVAGLLVWALARRQAMGLAPITVLCCDNLPGNGAMLRSLLLDMARRMAPRVVEDLAERVAFPSTMVDRITPAATPQTLALAETLTGYEDRAAVETEPFTQWIVEDRFAQGRPAWEAGGALFVADVRPFEEMKLRMLNGAHSMLAYAGCLAGHAHVRDVMGDAALAHLVARHVRAAAATLGPVPGIDLDRYGADLCVRFANPHLAHATAQIAMDGTEKLPQRIFAPAAEALARGQDPAPFAFAAAAWMRYALGRSEAGAAYDLGDPRAPVIAAAVDGLREAGEIVAALQAIPGLVPPALRQSTAWREAVTQRLHRILAQGIRACIDREAADYVASVSM